MAKRYSQPQNGPVRLSSNLFGCQNVFSYLPTTGSVPLSNPSYGGTLVGTPTKGIGKVGISYHLNDGVDTDYLAIAGKAITFPANVGICSIVTFSTTDSYGPLLSYRNSGTSTPDWDLCIGINGIIDTPGNLVAAVRDDASNIVYTSASSCVVNDGKIHTVALYRTSAGLVGLTIDGNPAEVTWANSNAGSTFTFTTNRQAIGCELEWVSAASFTAPQRCLSAGS